ncbi:MAG: hypothetical protein NUV69_01405 [Candidatus Curtissbacteria bacterium]|nr:hypothetical protein [Candidatus Curtissbacteria bacterium]
MNVLDFSRTRKGRQVLKSRSGMVLVTLLVFMAVGIIITSAAVVIVLVNSQATSRFFLGEEAYAAAESGAENAILRLQRDPNYAGESGMIIGRGTANITVSGSSTKTIVSESTVGSYKRKIQVVGNYQNFIFTPTSWVEIN